jgi:hypothetical protein
MIILNMHSRSVAIKVILMGLSIPLGLIHAQEDGNFTDEMLEELLFGKGLDEALEKKPSPWSKNLNVMLGGGHSDNPLQGPHLQTEAGFATASVDTFLLRMGKDDSVLYIYLYGEGNYYSGIPSLDLTGIALAQAEYSATSSTTGFGRGVRLRHTYYDMVFDMSENLDSPYSFTVQSNKSEMRPFVSFPLGKGLTGTVELAAARDAYAMSSEDYGEKEFRSIVKWKGEKDRSLNFYIFCRWKDYDERLQKDRYGFSMSSTSETRTFGSGISGSRTLGKEDDWKVSLSGYLHKTTDNAGGYYDYTSLNGNLKLSHEIGSWTLSASIRASHSEYDVRKTSTSELFKRNGFGAEFEADRKINEKWNIFAVWKNERDYSNDPDYEYEANVFSAGMKWSN